MNFIIILEQRQYKENALESLAKHTNEYKMEIFLPLRFVCFLCLFAFIRVKKRKESFENIKQLPSFISSFYLSH